MMLGDKQDLFGAGGNAAQASAAVPKSRNFGSVFFAIYPDEPAIDGALAAWEQIRRACALTGKPRPRQTLHVTLLALGHFPNLSPAVIEAACKGAEAIDLPSFDIVLERGLTFVNRQAEMPIVLTTAEDAAKVKMVRQGLLGEMKRRGVPLLDGKASYTPHMTIKYDSATVAQRAVAPVSWRVRDFALVHSHHGDAHHERLATWSLRD